MNHVQVQDLLAGYVLGALESREQEALLAHIQSCVFCFLLAQEHMEVAAKLAGGIPEAEAPACLRARILAAFAGRPEHLSSFASKMPYRPRSEMRWRGVCRRPRSWKGSWTRNSER
jgi:hypothetical protein